MSRTARNISLVAVPFALLALAACGDDSNSDNQGAAPAATTAVPAAATTAAPAATTAPSDGGGSGGPYGGGYAVPPTEPAAEVSGEAGLQLMDNSEYGKILVDAESRTLYLFMLDTDGTSACDASCASSWPPLLADGDLTLSDGLEDEDVGTITRADGTMQVTFYGHPLYHYGGDQELGDTKGQGSNEVWFVVDGEGNAVIEE